MRRDPQGQGRGRGRGHSHRLTGVKSHVTIGVNDDDVDEDDTAASQPRCRTTLVWLIVFVVLLAIIIGLLSFTLTAVLFIRGDATPHCYQIFATGPDVIPGPGEPAPFAPNFGGLLKGYVEVGDFCVKWGIVCFNLTDTPTSMAIHGPLTHNASVADVWIDLGVGGLDAKDGHLVRKDCLEVTYEQEFGILARPGDFYLQLANDAFPDGAVRAPLGTRCGGSMPSI